MKKEKVYIPKQEMTRDINSIIIPNMMDWKSTTSVTIKEWNKLNKELDLYIKNYLKRLGGLTKG